MTDYLPIIIAVVSISILLAALMYATLCLDRKAKQEEALRDKNCTCKNCGYRVRGINGNFCTCDDYCGLRLPENVIGVKSCPYWKEAKK